ncbi:hypothetical protein NCAS_0C01750 [Naumovozyma castellii]|uniref:Metacaspase-1 n=1 Tax=Naumovozyma castellii TaxID=27288 RepID=G0VCF5_NAUCA|nr:hypothetical protein NCAS_0C01750 [Naumovozyma castellii CBS 4309]CCC69165.1 hypothetical protein NCAS_0C01750 [Naumovozyma castellii CBS 4309]
MYPNGQQYTYSGPSYNQYPPQAPPVPYGYVDQYGYPAPPPPHVTGYYNPQYTETPAPQPYWDQPIYGKRKALLIGINYIGSRSQLSGCINDVNNMLGFLTQRCGYSQDDIVILTDDQPNPVCIPTKYNMLRAMSWLVKDVQPGDHLFLHYSGHGGQTPDLDGDEADGMDDVIYPVDFETQGFIVDDLMHDIMVRPLMQGVRLTALFDSCHSGTVLDLPFTYSTKGVIKEPSMLKDIGGTGMQAAMAYATGNGSDLMGSLSSLANTVQNRFINGNGYDRERVIQMKFSPADVIMLSGSKDNQTSADTFEDGQNIGAMSHAFIKVMTFQPQQTYISLLQNIRQALMNRYSQRPQLSSSHQIDINAPFII